MDSDGQALLILFRDNDSVAAEIVVPPPNDPRFDPTLLRVVELTSILEGYRGVLCTNSRLPFGPSYWKGEIRQHFPGASVTALIDEHERAVRLLDGRGIQIEQYPVDRLHEERLWGLRRMAAAQASTSSRMVIRQIKAQTQRPPRPFGRLENDPALWERLRDLPPARSMLDR